MKNLLLTPFFTLTFFNLCGCNNGGSPASSGIEPITSTPSTQDHASYEPAKPPFKFFDVALHQEESFVKKVNSVDSVGLLYLKMCRQELNELLESKTGFTPDDITKLNRTIEQRSKNLPNIKIIGKDGDLNSCYSNYLNYSNNLLAGCLNNSLWVSLEDKEISNLKFINNKLENLLRSMYALGKAKEKLEDETYQSEIKHYQDACDNIFNVFYKTPIYKEKGLYGFLTFKIIEYIPHSFYIDNREDKIKTENRMRNNLLEVIEEMNSILDTERYNIKWGMNINSDRLHQSIIQGITSRHLQLTFMEARKIDMYFYLIDKLKIQKLEEQQKNISLCRKRFEIFKECGAAVVKENEAALQDLLDQIPDDIVEKLDAEIASLA